MCCKFPVIEVRDAKDDSKTIEVHNLEISMRTNKKLSYNDQAL